LNQTLKLLLTTLEKDTTRLDVLQEVGKIYYYLRDYDNSYKYYKRFLETKKALNLDIYPSENANIAVVLSELGLTRESKNLMNEFRLFAENNQSIYKHYLLATYYSYTGNTEKAIEHLRLFSNEENYFYWVFTFGKFDPMFDHIKDNKEFKMIFKSIETKFWNRHSQVKTALKEKKLI
jgi:tetratricopeptide (TPR) repeat protein